MPIDLKSALAFLVTRPSRPRYQARSLHPDFIAADAEHARADTERTHATLERFSTGPARLWANSAGSVPLWRGPIAVAGLVVLAIGAGTILH